jgi:hypothetical protein
MQTAFRGIRFSLPLNPDIVSGYFVEKSSPDDSRREVLPIFLQLADLAANHFQVTQSEHRAKPIAMCGDLAFPESAADTDSPRRFPTSRGQAHVC